MSYMEKPSFTLRAVYLRESIVSMKDGFNPLHNRKKLVGQFRISSQQIMHGQEEKPSGEKQNFCLITTAFEFGYFLEGKVDEKVNIDDQDFVVSISAKISVDYTIKNGGDSAQDAITDWAQRNTLIHAWPYWREYCQSIQMRMNLPVLIIPLYNLPDSSSDKSLSHD